ncbi:hypothetical protein PIB30_087745 [Stylosanthes scabra]|uniref:Uncharacterized protein n=1 Tax=Stylosanthes scabra TaxID=79078 RepID=A0ABU6ZS88_9FABA|nr:hypothetical protein [Stylosanthes scabra]
MNLLGPQHYALLETDDQLRVVCGVLDKKEMDSLGMDESRFITCGESEFKAYNGIFTSFTTIEPRDLLNMNWNPILVGIQGGDQAQATIRKASQQCPT